MIVDFDAELFGSLWRIVPAVLAVTFMVLLIAFRSVLIPAKAVLTNLVSVLAAYGFLVLVFQQGAGAALLHIDPPGGLNSMVVLMLFTILFGLSMDYEVFLLRQIEHEYRRSGDNRTAVAAGLARSAGLITSAAAIMVCLFGSFGFTQLTATREFGLGLAFAVALDATLIRLVLVPAMMELFGVANWWWPFGYRHMPNASSSQRIGEWPAHELE
jgi:RND superfamily putative drug exporter